MNTLRLIQLSQQGDKAARDRIIIENAGLVWSIVRRFINRGHELEDLFQIGNIGLMKAIDNFNTDYDVKFSTYAVPMITGEIKRHLRDDGMIKVSRSLKEIAGKVKNTKEMLNNQLNRDPTLEEISEQINVPVDDIIMAMEANAEVESLYKTIYQGDGNAIYLIDKIERGEDDHENIVNHIALREVLDSLNEKDRNIIKLRYFEEKTQTEIANMLGISQVQVSRLERKILKSMRESMI